MIGTRRQSVASLPTGIRRPEGHTPTKGNTVNRKKVIAFCAIMAVAAAGVAVAGSASADPVSNTYVLAGSDTLQDASNALVNGTSVTGSPFRTVAADGTLGSFDAFGSASIQTKSGRVYFARPAGSGDGIKALERSIDGTPYSVANNATPAVSITGSVDIARSSGKPSNPNDNSGLLAYTAFGRDAVSYAYKGGTNLGAISTADLKLLYQCDAATLATYGGVTPVLPQSASGTRKFFLAAIGITTPASCVVNGTRAGVDVQENDGTQINANELIPFSVASYFAQSTNVAQNRTNGALLGTPLGATLPIVSGAPNQTYYNDTTWGRDTYLVVEYARINPNDPKFDQGLANLMNPAKATSLSNFGASPTSSGGVKRKYGFLVPSDVTLHRADFQ